MHNSNSRLLSVVGTLKRSGANVITTARTNWAVVVLQDMEHMAHFLVFYVPPNRLEKIYFSRRVAPMAEINEGFAAIDFAEVDGHDLQDESNALAIIERDIESGYRIVHNLPLAAAFFAATEGPSCWTA